MAVPVRNTILDRVKEAGSLTDGELLKALAKYGLPITEDRFNKTLLDLEIMGLVKVSWLTKEARRIEITDDRADGVDGEADNLNVGERDYEASFPGAE